MRRSMRDPSVASVGAQIAAEMPKAAISKPGFSIGSQGRRDLVEQPADAQKTGRNEEISGDRERGCEIATAASDSG